MSGFEPKWTLAQRFYADFNVAASELVFRLDSLKNTTNVTSTSIQAATSDLSRLTKLLGDATGSLPSYDQRQCELKLKTLEKDIEELRSVSATKPKFFFKRKTTKPRLSTEAPTDGSSSAKPQSTLIEAVNTLSSFSRRYLSFLDVRTPVPSAELSISDLDNCIVNILPSDRDRTKITALYVQRVSRSVLLLPQITGSIILHGLLNCVVVVGCHQFRMHDSTVVDVYLDGGSDPIIEHCSRIRFAAYPISLAREGYQASEDFDVKDFSHILSTPSPNWSVLVEEKWQKSWPVASIQGLGLQEELERLLPTHGE